MKFFPVSNVLLSAASLAIASAALAPAARAAQPLPPQSLPGAIGSELQRQGEMESEQRRAPALPPSAPVLSAPPRTETKPLAGEVSFRLEEVEFSPSSLLSKDELQALAQPLIGQEVRLSDLQTLVEEVNRLYDQRGASTARAILPAQKVKSGKVLIQLVEGKVGEVKLENLEYLSPSFVTNRLPLTPGEVIDPPRLQEALQRFNRISEVKARAALGPGADFGLTDIQLSVMAPKRDTLDFIFNNHGYESAGEYTGAMFYRRTGLLGGDDRFNTYLSGSRGTLSGNLSYDLPVNRYGTRVGASVGASTIKVISGPFSALDVTGRSNSVALNASHPLWADDQWLVNLSASVDRSSTRNYISGVFLNENIVKSRGLGLTAQYQGFSRQLSASANWVNSTSETQGKPQQDVFDVWTGSFAWLEQLDDQWSGLLSANWQVASKAGLPSSQLFQIGGASTVRGYSQGALGGDGGYVVNGQLTRAFNDSFAAFAFVDYGHVKSSFIQPDTLSSAGLGMRWEFGKWQSGELVYGQPLQTVSPQQDKYKVYFRVVLHAL